MALRPGTGTHSAVGIAASAGAAFLLLLGAAVCTSAHAPQLSGLIASDPPTSSQFYVAANGRAAATGGFDDPWDLATALAQPAAVKPGDTFWLRGGTYVGIFNSNLTGTLTSPIQVRQYPGERATLDGGTNPPSYGATTLTVNGAYTWYIGFEVTNSNTTRTSPISGSSPPDRRTYGLDVFAPGTKIINMVIHDTGEGIGLWNDATDAEAYGNLIYYNGWDAPDRGHGHSIYVQSTAPYGKTLKDNVMFAQFDIGIHAYTEGGHLDNIYLEGNTEFIEGILSGNYTYNILLGGLQVANNPSMISNYTYTPFSAGGDNNLGYSAGCTNATVIGNYFTGRNAFNLVNCSSGLSMTSNSFYGSLSGFTDTQYPDNTYTSTRPFGLQVFVRANKYESGRANITIYNWDLSSAVDVDLTGVLTVGSEYEIRNAQDYFGTPTLTGKYAGGKVSLPLAGLSVAAPVGVAIPPATGPEFNAFVLLSSGIGRAAPSLSKARPKTHALERHS